MCVIEKDQDDGSAAQVDCVVRSVETAQDAAGQEKVQDSGNQVRSQGYDLIVGQEDKGQGNGTQDTPQSHDLIVGQDEVGRQDRPQSRDLIGGQDEVGRQDRPQSHDLIGGLVDQEKGQAIEVRTSGLKA